MTSFGFEIGARCPGSSARAGVIHTPHGDVLTPCFAPVGTQGTVKAVSPDDLREIGVDLVLANTYHLYLRPGHETISRLGGLHRFMGWDRALLTDSGGFQVFSLEHRAKITDEGVLFRSHIDGSEHFFSPERVTEIQEKIGADIIMAFDQCVAVPATRSDCEEAMHRTHRWLERGLAARTRADQAFFGIVQGGVEPDLRKASAEFITRLDLPGYAIGGLSVGEPKEQMLAILDGLMPLLPADRPRYLMGVGSPEDLVEGVARGVDLFDCVLATRIARNGALLVRTGRVNIRNAQYREDPNPIEPGCTCATCRHFSRAYIHHLFRAEELLGYRLTSLHNIHFLARLMEEIRRSVAAGTFPAFRRDFLAGFDVRDEGVRRENRDARRHSQPD